MHEAFQPMGVEKIAKLTQPYTRIIMIHIFYCAQIKVYSLFQEIKINGEPAKPFALQMGAGSNGTCNNHVQIARMALSHPILPIQPSIPKDVEQYGSHSQIYDISHKKALYHGHRTSRRGSNVMLRKDILYAGSLCNIPEYK